jgi:hypothetical protein
VLVRFWAGEARIKPAADEVKGLRDLIHDADAPYRDTEREIVIFGKVDWAAGTSGRIAGIGQSCTPPYLTTR